MWPPWRRRRPRGGASGASSLSMMATTAGVSVDDVFLRRRSVVRRGVLRYRRLPFVLRMAGVCALGFVVGAVLEVFACKTQLYESVMAKKAARRRDFDEFVVDLRHNVERWQNEDEERRQQRQQQRQG